MRAPFYICTVQHGDHQLHVATENLKCGQCYWGIDFLILLHFNSFQFKQSHLRLTYIACIFCHKDYFHLVLQLYAFKIILDRSFVVVGRGAGWPVHWRMFSSISAMPQLWQSKSVPKHCQNAQGGWGGKNHTQFKTTDLRLRVWILYSVLRIF